MSDNRKKSRRRRSVDEAPELTAIEKSIAKHLRFQCPTKKGMLMGMQVAYFNGTKAVECLIESKWSSISTRALAGQSTKDSKTPVCFSSKHDAVQMLRKFLDCEMFRRVVKIYKEEKPSSDQTSSNNAGDTSQSNTPRPVRQRKTKTTTNESTTTTTTGKDDDAKEKDKDKTKKKKFKFELHDDQAFMDSINEFYVWIYSPTTIKQYIMGALLVIGCIGVCLFPLWPAEVRTGVYYLSIVLASLLGVLLSLAVVKYIIFAGVWLLTLGKIKFWLLPNLTEDVGFFESFVPLYTLNLTTSKKKTNKNDNKKENDDAEEEDDVVEKSTNKKENLNEDNKSSIESNVTVGQTENEQDDEEEKEKSTSRSSSIDDVDDGNKPQKSSDEDFEVLSKDELETK